MAYITIDSADIRSLVSEQREKIRRDLEYAIAAERDARTECYERMATIKQLRLELEGFSYLMGREDQALVELLRDRRGWSGIPHDQYRIVLRKRQEMAQSELHQAMLSLRAARFTQQQRAAEIPQVRRQLSDVDLLLRGPDHILAACFEQQGWHLHGLDRRTA